MAVLDVGVSGVGDVCCDAGGGEGLLVGNRGGGGRILCGAVMGFLLASGLRLKNTKGSLFEGI